MSNDKQFEEGMKFAFLCVAYAVLFFIGGLVVGYGVWGT